MTGDARGCSSLNTGRRRGRSSRCDASSPSKVAFEQVSRAATALEGDVYGGDGRTGEGLRRRRSTSRGRTAAHELEQGRGAMALQQQGTTVVIRDSNSEVES
ncbi:lysogenization regulator HflD [Sesbania bispinosa]|nr:lysogenization regulator HflD [Sesbania bispinosa]